MPLPRDVYEEMIAQHAVAARITARLRLIAALKCIAWCWFWAGLGLFLLGWSFHTTDYQRGLVAYWLGLGVGNGGVLFSLVAYWRGAEDRGDAGGPPG